VASHVKPGITTDQLDEICHQACIERDSYPSPLNYAKFPKSVCTSVNEVICHVSLRFAHISQKETDLGTGYTGSTTPE
jgi:methionine aminopeptidase